MSRTDNWVPSLKRILLEPLAAVKEFVFHTASLRLRFTFHTDNCVKLSMQCNWGAPNTFYSKLEPVIVFLLLFYLHCKVIYWFLYPSCFSARFYRLVIRYHHCLDVGSFITRYPCAFFYIEFLLMFYSHSFTRLMAKGLECVSNDIGWHLKVLCLWH